MADSSNTTSIKVVRASLEVETLEEDEVFILRGVVDPDSLERLKVADYQRERLSGPKIDGIMDGIRSHSVPDIVLGMRGEHMVERGDTFHLQNPVYIIDGYQRRTAALRLMNLPDDVVPALGCKVHLNSNYTFEKALFSKLNLGQTKLSPNITLRNLTDENAAIEALFKLTEDKAFRLFNQVGWNQRKRTVDLISAVTYVQVAAMLHSHAGPGRSKSAVELANGLGKIMETVNKKNMVENVRRFYQLIDQCWGLGQITYTDRVSYVKASFLLALANVLSDHSTFWDGDLLVVSQSNQNRLAKFPINDNEIMRLSSAGGGLATKNLAFLMIEHMNHNRRTGRLVRRGAARPPVVRDRPGRRGGGMIIRGTTEECLKDFFGRYEWEVVRPFVAKYAGVEKSTVRRWYNGALPTGEELIKVRVMLDLKGYRVTEFEALPVLSKQFAQAMALNLIGPEEASEMLGYRNTQGLYEIVLRNKEPLNDKWYRIERWTENSFQELETAVSTFQRELEELPKEPGFDPEPTSAPAPDLAPATPSARMVPPGLERKPLSTEDIATARMVPTGPTSSRLTGPLARATAYGLMQVSDLLDLVVSNPHEWGAVAKIYAIIPPEDVQEIVRKLERLNALNG